MSSLPSSPETRVYRAVWQDGSIDLFAGLALAGTGIAWLAGAVALGALAPAVAVPFWTVLRNRFVEPRLGQARFGPARRKRLLRAHIVLIAVGCAALLIFLTGYFRARGTPSGDAWVRAAVPALPAALVGFGAGLAALLFAIPRVALHGLTFLVAGVLVALLDLDPGWSLLAGGLVTAACGCFLLLRFAHEFPLLPTEPE